MTAVADSSGMGSAPDEQYGPSQSVPFGVHPPLPGMVRDGNRALTRWDRMEARPSPRTASQAVKRPIFGRNDHDPDSARTRGRYRRRGRWDERGSPPRR